MNIHRDYYPIADAAKMIGCTEADLIHLGANDKLDVYGLFKASVMGERAGYDSESDDPRTPHQCFGMGPYIIDSTYLKQIEAGKEPGECSVVWHKIDGDWHMFNLVAATPDLFIEIGENSPITMPGLFGCKEAPKLVLLTEDIEQLKTKAAGNSHPAPGEPYDNTPSPETGVTVTLPHMTKALEAVFSIMRENWTNPDPRRLPKQVNIGREIDAAMGWGKKGDPNSEPSRDAKALAKIIKPDAITADEADTDTE